MLPKEQEKAYRAFYNFAWRNEILPAKTTLMIQLAAAMGVACYP